ncbi:MAG: TIGR03087 family PEP-CTERM/XrtA system glycosyltransferase [Thalassotalea sp.]|nr:TIGR03087 family PEP-CTERM/XrtA system glycosyltransferase [Thalassotalea sp.]MDG2394697.1 TIGR03087 family PEP-CTERM/XrtA system glycosyltransferase [Thalassotalea sp.]
MRILFICQRVPYPPNKGEKIRTYNQIKFILSCGFKVHIACPTESIDDQKFARQLAEHFNLKITCSKLPNKFIRYSTSILKNNPISLNFFYSAKLQTKINKLIYMQDVLIMCSSSAVAEYYFTYCRQFPDQPAPPLIVDFMDLDSLKWQQYKQFSGPIKKIIFSREAKLLKKYEFSIQKSALHCLFTSQVESDLFTDKQHDFNNILKISNGIDLDYFTPMDKIDNSGNLNFIFTGVMDYFPNVDAVTWFCEVVWLDIIAKYPKATFTIVGMNPTASIKKLSQLPGVNVTGFVDDIRDYYNQADFFIAPLRIARGVQNKVLEAFASNIPVICTSNATQGINCQAETHYLLANNNNEFKEQIFRLIEDTSLRNRLTKNSLSLVKQEYSWPAQLTPLKKVISSLVSQQITKKT